MADPTSQSFRLAIGQARAIEFTLDAADDVTGWTLRFRLRSHSGPVLVEKTSGSGVAATDEASGVWDVTLSAADTADLVPGQYDWSLWRTDEDSEGPLAYGTAAVYRTAETG